ncbi:hypothetical protein J6590_050147 [Homalodisca vitripennis]|nr:hypothetical protein J6590_050147 [Homalodisca vitripennis]
MTTPNQGGAIESSTHNAAFWWEANMTRFQELSMQKHQISGVKSALASDAARRRKLGRGGWRTSRPTRPRPQCPGAPRSSDNGHSRPKGVLTAGITFDGKLNSPLIHNGMAGRRAGGREFVRVGACIVTGSILLWVSQLLPYTSHSMYLTLYRVCLVIVQGVP